jgi:hypothetical protein
MRKIGTILASIALVLGLGIQATPAQATENGTFTETYSCYAGGTRSYVFITMHVSGVGTSAPNTVVVDRLTWDTDPRARLNQIQVQVWDHNNNGFWLNWFNIGNGVIDSVDSTGGYYINTFDYVWPNGGLGQIRVQRKGGVGTSTASCIVTKDVP